MEFGLLYTKNNIISDGMPLPCLCYLLELHCAVLTVNRNVA